jgi:hypothetical protein
VVESASIITDCADCQQVLGEEPSAEQGGSGERSGGGRDAEGLGLGRDALTGKVSALLGRALTALSDLVWSAVFRTAELLETPPPTPEQLYEQHLREREQAITEWLETHRREEPWLGE